MGSSISTDVRSLGRFSESSQLGTEIIGFRYLVGSHGSVELGTEMDGSDWRVFQATTIFMTLRMWETLHGRVLSKNRMVTLTDKLGSTAPIDLAERQGVGVIVVVESAGEDTTVGG